MLVRLPERQTPSHISTESPSRKDSPTQHRTAITASGVGTGYVDGEYLTIEGAAGDVEVGAASARVRTVGNTGVIDSVQVMNYGDYYHTDGVIASVEVQNGGRYWDLVPTGSADSDSPDVFFSSNIGRDASGVAVIDTTPASPSFGRITAITLSDGGTGYKSAGGGWTLSFSHPDLIALSPNEDHPSYTTDQPCPLSLADATYLDQKYRTFDGLDVSIELAMEPA